MFGGKSKLTSAVRFPFIFKDNQSAFECACKYMNCKISVGFELAALVLDAKELFGLPESVQLLKNGIQSVSLKVSSDDGGFSAISQTAHKNGPTLHSGDLVSWRPFKFLPDVGRKMGDRRTGWIGLVTALLSPTLLPDGWVELERFGP